MRTVVPPLVGLMLLAMGLQASGEALQKRGLDRRSLAIWLGGFTIAIASALATIQALAGLDLSLVSGLAATKILFASLIAVAFLRERLAPREWLALAGIFAGAVLLAGDADASGHFELSAASSLGLVFSGDSDGSKIAKTLDGSFLK